jgi:enterochelin esterase-like enzyme
MNAKDITRLFLLCAIAACSVAGAQTARPQPPMRDPHTPGYVHAVELPDGVVPPADRNGNFILGPTHPPAPELHPAADVPRGRVCEFTMRSTESTFYPGIAQDAGTFNRIDPQHPDRMLVTAHAAPYVRTVVVYVPAGYLAGIQAPLLVGEDGPDRRMFPVLDALIAEKRIPALVFVSIGNGGGDAQGSERGLEYDTMSGRYAEFVQTEVLPAAEAHCQVQFTSDPDGRATMGASSGGSAALAMAWFHPEWYHRVLTYSGTFVNQQWPWNPQSPHGAWEFHEHWIADAPRKPLRLWLEVGDRDLLNPNALHDGMHDWVVANERMARVLAAKGYPYQFVFARNAGHVERAVLEQTLPEALTWLWRGYAPMAVGGAGGKVSGRVPSSANIGSMRPSSSR